MRKRSLTLVALCATLLWAGAIYGAPPKDKITKTLTFAMPACPIAATIVPSTFTDFTLPDMNPLGIVESGELSAVSVTGTVQVADQSGGVIFKISTDAEADLTGVSFDRTVNTIQHATGELTFDRGCTSTDPFGSNHCTWPWGDSITAHYEGALQEDITSGKLVVDLKIDNTIPLSFACPVCGAKCAITIPEQLDGGRWEQVLHLMIRLIQFPFAVLRGAS